MKGKKVIGENQNDKFAKLPIFLETLLNFSKVRNIVFSTWYEYELYHEMPNFLSFKKAQN